MCNSSGVFGVPQAGDENGDKVVRNDFVKNLVEEVKRQNTIREKQNELLAKMRKYTKIVIWSVVFASLAFVISVFSGYPVAWYCKVVEGVAAIVFLWAWFRHDYIYNKGQGL